MSLRHRLLQIIKDADGEIVSINQIEQLCREWHYKMSNAERQLRPSLSANLERIKKGNAIVGYRWKELEIPIPVSQDKQTTLPVVISTPYH